MFKGRLSELQFRLKSFITQKYALQHNAPLSTCDLATYDFLKKTNFSRRKTHICRKEENKPFGEGRDRNRLLWALNEKKENEHLIR
ncbi:CLUMA_CG007987, isoform A [Clunio marinus]|uniref:CLUMA_CG007987, isoform A n=1 Tax=Clunio marinus TaxID=568069 RepID=A0A1J1I7V2_9DIPT|nr:CLUMA_CG007987, isoform A [Clunio marinus]